MDIRINVPEGFCPNEFLIELAQKRRRERFYMHRMCVENLLENKKAQLSIVENRECILVCWTDNGEETRMFLKEFVRDRWYKVVSIWTSDKVEFIENGLGLREPRDFIWMQMEAK